ncbi:MAG: rhodanese-like domain-containing protein, partial [Eggerthellaceae bacterium]|nr:rhodanese-like domain-containing protein [Eggerthellaceae bacterium]
MKFGKSIAAVALSCALSFGAFGLVGCSSDDSANTQNETNTTESVLSDMTNTNSASSSTSTQITTGTAKQYITVDELQEAIADGEEDLVMFDCRQASDFDAGHIEGSISVDLDAAVNGDYEAG